MILAGPEDGCCCAGLEVHQLYRPPLASGGVLGRIGMTELAGWLDPHSSSKAMILVYLLSVRALSMALDRPGWKNDLGHIIGTGHSCPPRRRGSHWCTGQTGWVERNIPRYSCSSGKVGANLVADTDSGHVRSSRKSPESQQLDRAREPKVKQLVLESQVPNLLERPC
ncbi:hypothetical protein GWK47_040447 [Chionoecetes opilio]|uniref:Uncharacterized protein n=1 Tax=Chionoecetes opilio TaxID=41210 RepID=A0A8J5D0X3_CHIOP|nr:hypothetical protein GWK47_040447 [Chionoecetes opilio]